MPISQNLLGEGEYVILATRTHWKALVLPAIVLIVTCAVAGFVYGIVPAGSSHDPIAWGVVVVAAIVIVWFCLWPFLTWLTAEYNVTNRRLINRAGVITRTGRDIPLYRINDVSYERDLLDRILGCGTLVIAVANEEGKTTMRDVPRVESVQLKITELLFGGDDGADDDGTPFRGPEPDRR